MTSGLDDLEGQVMAEMRKVYSEKAIDHAMNPRNVGNIPNADGFGTVTGSCGDTMEIWLKVKDGKVVKATFSTDGCGTSIACGSMVTEMITGKGIIEARRISQDDVLRSLGGLPEESTHCALLATNTVREAVRDYLAVKNEPWKKAYRRQ